MTVPALRGVRPGRMGKLTMILEEWKNLMQNTANEWAPKRYRSKRDCPWWYPERTSVGFLSAAIWKIGGEAIEEYGTDRKKKSLPKRSEGGYSQKGCGDLMFCVNKSWRRQSSFVAEAKQTWPSINSTLKKLQDRVNDRLSKAMKDARRTRRYGCTRLGL